MKDTVSVSNILTGKHDDKEVKIAGWLFNKRSSGSIHFLLIRDGSGIIQATLGKNDVDEKTFEKVERLTQESSLVVTGQVKKDQRAPKGYELRIKNLEIVHLAEEYPLGKKEHGIDFLLDNRHLWIRSPKQSAVTRIRSEVMKASRDFFEDKGFVLVDTPILTPSTCEDTTTLFKTPYFGKKAYLAQSGQLYNEANIAAFGKVFCFGPTFRAEKSRTIRHLAEFWMIEPEMAFTDLEEMMKVEEDLITYIVDQILTKRTNELEILERDIELLRRIRPPFPRISYDDALKILEKNDELKIPWGENFGASHERFISEQFEKPVIVHRYPAKIKAFYMQPDSENPNLVLCNDVLAPEGYGEIIGGSERIWDLKLLEKRIKDFKMPKKQYEWYLDLRRYGSVPHSGFGMGIERVVAWICKLENVREAIPYPRTMTRLYP